MNDRKIILEMKNITKLFPGVRALDDVNLRICEGEIHALVGENGAGKSTLMNILSGIYTSDSYSGKIIFNGEESKFSHISESEKVGIAIIHQELALIPYLSIAENMYLGHENAKAGVINWEETHSLATEYLSMVGMHERTDTLATHIGIGKQQLVEIARALSKECRLLILDEPTAALNDSDSRHLLNLLLDLKKSGMTCILISHKLDEVLEVADKITVLRDGKTIIDLDNDEHLNENTIVRYMVGRELTDRYPVKNNEPGEIVFEVKEWTVFHPIHAERKMIDDVSLNVRRGEVVGIAGLMGAGRTELAMSIFGKSYGRNISGEIYKDGNKIDISTVPKAIDAGVVYLSEDRKDDGLILNNSILENVTLSNLKKVSKNNIINRQVEIVEASKETKRFGVKSTSIHQKTLNLSGGNQQKVVLAKWMFCNPDVLILDEPTRGIDVGAKFDIYNIMFDLTKEGKAILFISSEFHELLGVCDRIYVLNEGCINGEIVGEDVKTCSQEQIMKLLI